MSNFIRVFLGIPSDFLRQLASGHLHFLLQSLDPIAQKPSESSSVNLYPKFINSPKFNACLAIALQVYTIFYGIFGFIPLSSISSLDDILQSDLLYSHQILPRAAWSQIDAGYAIDMLASVAIFAVIGLNRPPRYQIVLQPKSNEKEEDVEVLLINEQSKQISYKVIKYF